MDKKFIVNNSEETVEENYDVVAPIDEDISKTKAALALIVEEMAVIGAQSISVSCNKWGNRSVEINYKDESEETD